MAHVKKLFIIPIGLPGMGKTTLSKHLEQASLKTGKLSFELIYKKISYDKMLGDNQKAY